MKLPGFIQYMYAQAQTRFERVALYLWAVGWVVWLVTLTTTVFFDPSTLTSLIGNSIAIALFLPQVIVNIRQSRQHRRNIRQMRARIDEMVEQEKLKP